MPNIPHICHITKFKNNILNIKKFFIKITVSKKPTALVVG